MNERLRHLPKMDTLLETDDVRQLLTIYRRDYIVETLRQLLDETRHHILEGSLVEFELIDFLERLKQRLKPKHQLRPVINATGVVIHTNLGRSPLSRRVMEHVTDLATGYSNLEYDLDQGKRGERYSHLAEYFRRLTGCEDVHIVNNNASAVMLVLHTLAKDKQVVVSRGELVEIGGSFRIPDIMSISRARLVEVGTTNRTHLADYQRAINSDTGLLMKVHQSNFYIEGFTTEVSSAELRRLADEYQLPLYEDLGSGYLVNIGLATQMDDLRDLLQTVDLVSISGDKLLGGPQAGIILGKAELIQKLKKDQLTRALRVDKLTLSALEAVLIDYIERDPVAEVPTLAFLSRDQSDLYAQARRLQEAISLPGVIEDGQALVGGGSLPRERLNSPKLVIEVDSANQLEEYLRNYSTPIISTIRDNKVLIDVRCIREEEQLIVIEALNSWRNA